MDLGKQLELMFWTQLIFFDTIIEVMSTAIENPLNSSLFALKNGNSMNIPIVRL